MSTFVDLLRTYARSHTRSVATNGGIVIRVSGDGESVMDGDVVVRA